MDIILKINRVIKFLSIIAVFLIIMNIVMLIIYFNINDPEKFDFVRMVDLDQEMNLPTLFSSTILLISAFLFYLLSKLPSEKKKGNTRYWLGLGLVFVFLAFDESAKIHETLGDLTENYVDHSGYLYYPWVISYTLFVIILGSFYFRFFWKMEKKLFRSFILAAAIFLSGAIGFELLGAKEASLHGTDTITYCIYYTIEESLEMFGVIYLIHILLNILAGKSLQLEY